MGPLHPFLTIHAEHRADAYVIGLEGQLDLAGCADLDFALTEAEHVRADRIVLDLEQLTYIDSSGLKVLLDASRRSASNGNRLEMTRPTGHPADMLRLTSLDVTLPLVDSGGWKSPMLGPQAPPAEDANLPRLGERFVGGDSR